MKLSVGRPTEAFMEGDSSVGAFCNSVRFVCNTTSWNVSVLLTSPPRKNARLVTERLFIHSKIKRNNNVKCYSTWNTLYTIMYELCHFISHSLCFCLPNYENEYINEDKNKAHAYCECMFVCVREKVTLGLPMVSGCSGDAWWSRPAWFSRRKGRRGRAKIHIKNCIL